MPPDLGRGLFPPQGACPDPASPRERPRPVPRPRPHDQLIHRVHTRAATPARTQRLSCSLPQARQLARMHSTSSCSPPPKFKRESANAASIDLLWSRWREVEVHHLDLGLGHSAEDWPELLVSWMLPRLRVTVTSRRVCCDHRAERLSQQTEIAVFDRNPGRLIVHCSLRGSQVKLQSASQAMRLQDTRWVRQPAGGQHRRTRAPDGQSVAPASLIVSATRSFRRARPAASSPWPKR